MLIYDTELSPSQVSTLYNEQIGSTITYESDFTASTGWSASDSSTMLVDTSGGQNISLELKRDQSNDSMVYDLSSTSDDWVLRFKTTASQISSSVGAGNGFFIGLSDSDEATAQNSNQDFVGMSYYYDNTSSHRAIDADGASLPHLYEGDSHQNFSVSQGSDYWFEIIKDGTDYTIEAFTANDYSTGSQGQISGTTSATGLQYVKIMNEVSASLIWNLSGYTNPFIMTVDDMVFYDGITSVVETTGLGTSSPSTTNLIAHWDFEQTGDTLETVSYTHLRAHET